MSARDTWAERLDAAVTKQFPGVACETSWNLFSMQHTTRWWQAGTDDTLLKPALARQVKAFVAGFMASEHPRITKRSALRFTLYQDGREEWRWRLRARNNRVIADSAEGYKRKSSALKQIESIRDDAENAGVVTP